MANKLKPGDFKDLVVEDYGGFFGSMAATMDAELNRLLDLDDLPQLPTDLNDKDVRARRRLFVAIARGVVRHLVDNPDAFDVSVTGDGIRHPVIRME